MSLLLFPPLGHLLSSSSSTSVFHSRSSFSFSLFPQLHKLASAPKARLPSLSPSAPKSLSIKHHPPPPPSSRPQLSFITDELSSSLSIFPQLVLVAFNFTFSSAHFFSSVLLRRSAHSLSSHLPLSLFSLQLPSAPPLSPSAHICLLLFLRSIAPQTSFTHHRSFSFSSQPHFSSTDPIYVPFCYSYLQLYHRFPLPLAPPQLSLVPPSLSSTLLLTAYPP